MPHNDKHKNQQELYNKSKELYNAQNPSYLDRLMDFVTMSGPYSMQSVYSDIGPNAPWWIDQDYRNTKYMADVEEARAKGDIDAFSILETPMFQSMIKDAASDYGGNIQEAAFRNLKPSYSAGSFVNLYRNMRGDDPISMVDGKYRSDERMYGQALGLDYIPKLPESSYRPSKSKNPDAEYYSVMEYLNPAEVLKQLDALNSGFPTEQELREGFYSQGKTYSGRGSKHNVEFSDDPAFGYDKTAARANTFSKKDLETYDDFFHPLENFTMGAGQDDKGTYISIYDKYDVASPTLNKYLQPYEIYDRIYYTTDEQGNRIPIKKYGGNMKKINEFKGGGLWANIHAKRARGERMRKKGDPGAPTEEQMARARAAHGGRYMDVDYEAEGGEVVIGDISVNRKYNGGTAKQYKGANMFMLGGPSHADGGIGIKVNSDEPSYVFTDRLKVGGMKGATYADMAAKFGNELDDINTMAMGGDKYDRNTAKLMNPRIMEDVEDLFNDQEAFKRKNNI